MTVKQTPRLHDDWIDPDATDIVRQLQRRGYTTYLVGGCVRDLLIGRHPKDFDIVTTARPRDVKQCVRNAFIIGKRFRLVLAKRGDQQYEISTFRRDPEPQETAEDAAPSDNVFGTPEEDARRRDFTINALFFDPAKKKVIDFVDGLADLKEGVIRMIGDPMVRLEEDPIRIMRGIRLSHMIRFALEPSLRKGMGKLGHLLPGTALPRRREELLKFLRLEDPAKAFLTCHDLDILQYFCPSISAVLTDPRQAEVLVEGLNHFHDMHMLSPGDIFAGFMYVYCRAAHNLSFDSAFPLQKMLEDKNLNDFMHSELGMFNAEQITFKKSMGMIAHLQNRKDFERRGERRLWALFRNDGFELALKFAESFYLMGPEDLNFWKTEYSRRPTEMIEKSRNRKRKRRRRKKPSDLPVPVAENSNK